MAGKGQLQELLHPLGVGFIAGGADPTFPELRVIKQPETALVFGNNSDYREHGGFSVPFTSPGKNANPTKND